MPAIVKPVHGYGNSGETLENLHDRINSLLDFSLLALVKIGAVLAVLPLVFAALRTHDHYGYARADAVVVRTFKQCEISASAADRIGKRPRWWDCKSAKSLQRAFPTTDLKVRRSEFTEFRFVLPNGHVQQAVSRTSPFDMSRPDPGQFVPIVYWPDEPNKVKTLLTMEALGKLSLVGLVGLTLSMSGWRLRSRRAYLAIRICRWIRAKDEADADPEITDPVKSSGGRAVSLRGNRRGLGVG